MESIISRHLFIYSSLRNGFHQHAFDYITRYFIFISAARVKGILSMENNCAVATPTEEDHFIKGELYKLKSQEDFSFVFGQIDDYEGLDAEPDQKPLYRREMTTVYTNDGSVTEAWIYWFNGEVDGKPVITSGDVLEILN